MTLQELSDALGVPPRQIRFMIVRPMACAKPLLPALPRPVQPSSKSVR